MGWGERGEKEREKERERNGELRERSSTLSLDFPANGPRRFQVEQERKVILAARASHRDKKRGVLTNTKR